MSDTIDQELRNLHQAVGEAPTTERKAWTLIDGLRTLLERAIHASGLGETSEHRAPYQELHDRLTDHHGNLAAAVATRETAPASNEAAKSDTPPAAA